MIDDGISDGEGIGFVYSRYEALTPMLLGSGTLYLWPPLRYMETKLQSRLDALGVGYDDAPGGGLSVKVGEGKLRSMLSDLSDGTLTKEESRDTRAVFKTGSEALDAADIPRVEPLGSLARLVHSEWLLDLISNKKLTSVFQPIVPAGSPHEVYAQECLIRGAGDNGSVIPPSIIFETAKECGLLFQTDLAARCAAIREAAERGVDTGLFVNFIPTLVYDPEFCLSSTVEAVDEAGLPHESVTFEITEGEDIRDADHLDNIVDYCREQGFRIALDDMGSGYSSLNLVHRLRPDLIKLDLNLIRDVDTDPFKAAIARKLLELAHSLDIQTIAEGVETAGELDWVRDEGADFVQGYLIARPAATPPVPSRTS